MSDFFGGITDALSSGLSYVGKHLPELAIIGGGIYGTYRQQQARKQQQKEYENSLNAYNAAQGAGSGGGGGGGGAGKASKLYQQYYQQALAMYAPFVDSAKRLLPKQEEAYTKGLGGLSEIAKYMLTPESFALTNQSTPAYKVPLKLPDYMKGAG